MQRKRKSRKAAKWRPSHWLFKIHVRQWCHCEIKHALIEQQISPDQFEQSLIGHRQDRPLTILGHSYVPASSHSEMINGWSCPESTPWGFDRSFADVWLHTLVNLGVLGGGHLEFFKVKRSIYTYIYYSICAGFFNSTGISLMKSYWNPPILLKLLSMREHKFALQNRELNPVEIWDVKSVILFESQIMTSLHVQDCHVLCAALIFPSQVKELPVLQRRTRANRQLVLWLEQLLQQLQQGSLGLLRSLQFLYVGLPCKALILGISNFILT